MNFYKNHHKLRRFFAFALSIGLLFLTSCKKETSSEYRIICTTTMVADLAEHLVGDYVEIDTLMGPGIDPHSYTPTAGDVDRILSADFILYSGLHLEGKMTEVFEKLEEQDVKIHGVAEYLDPKDLIITEGGAYDPHVWWDAGLWSKTIDPLAKALSEALPEYSKEILSNGENYKQELLNLDREIQAEVKTIDKEQRYLITAHDAFNYYSRAYDIPVYGVQGLNTNDEAGAGGINELAHFIVEHKVPAIFPESSVSSKSVEVLIEATEGLGHKVILGEELYSDSLGNPNTEEGSYRGAMIRNTNRITKALKGGQ